MANRSSVTVSFRGKKHVGECETAGRILRVFFEGKSKTGAIRSSNVASVWVADLERVKECQKDSRYCEGIQNFRESELFSSECKFPKSCRSLIDERMRNDAMPDQQRAEQRLKYLQNRDIYQLCGSQPVT